MPSFNATKSAIEEAFAKVGAEQWDLEVVSYDTSGGESCLLLKARDYDGNQGELRFFGVQHISMNMKVGGAKLSLAQWQDAQPIQWSLGMNAPPWLVCIEESREGGKPAKYFIAAGRIEITLAGAQILATEKV